MIPRIPNCDNLSNQKLWPCFRPPPIIGFETNDESKSGILFNFEPTCVALAS